MRLALATIVKDEKDQVVRLINDYSKYFDELAFAIDDKKTYDELKLEFGSDPKIKLHKYEWIDDFADKRNFLASKIESEYYFRVDTDDVIQNAHFIQEAFKNYIKNGFTVVYFNYLYGFDESGNCNAMHWRETVIKNDGNIVWNKKIHENIKFNVERNCHAGKETKISIAHNHTKERALESLERNLKLILKEYEESKSSGEKPDPRTTGYLARMYMAKQEYTKAVPIFEEFISTSGWDDDKYFAWLQLADCFVYLGDLETATSCSIEALLLRPLFPDAYFHMMGIYYEKREWDKAIAWGEMGFSKPIPDTMYVLDPSFYTWRPAAQIAMCYVNAGMFEKAVKVFQKAREIAPKNQALKNTFTHFLDIYNDNSSVVSYLKLMDYVREDLKSFRLLVQSIPDRIRNDERILAVVSQVEPAKIWDKKSVVFFCGPAWEDWVDTSVIGGIGGSEEATVYMAREFVNLGYKVTVFNQCGELEGVYNGVEYLNYGKFHPKDVFDILICWRSNVLQDVKARKKYVWLHDVPSKNTIIDEDFDKIDGVIVLSEYHKSFLSHLKNQEKIIVSRNGLNIKDFLGVSEERNPRRIIYASSYDRGLQHLLEMWPEVKKEVPDAELHIFYGWNTYLEMMKTGRRGKDFYEDMCKLMKQDGITEHGRIGQKRLAREYAKSGIWAYPCHFEEISCIGAMRAQATGAVPITTNYAALAETVQYGKKVEMDVKGNDWSEYKKALIKALVTPEWQEKVRSEMVPASLSRFSWSEVAKTWSEKLF